MANQYTKWPNSQIFVKDSMYNSRHRMKKRLIDQNLIPYECFFCKNPGTWLKKKLILVIDHVNGVKNDNRLQNLRFVCPNCDSQLPTFKSKNIKYQKNRTTKQEPD